MSLTILDGTTFCISDELGDIGDPSTGFFAEDTRFLSIYALRVNGAPPLLLSSGRVEHFAASFYARNPLAGGLPQDSVSVMRERFVGVGLRDRVRVRNEGMEAVSLQLTFAFGTDFADVLTVKQHDFALGDPLRARPLPSPARPRAVGEDRLVLEEDGGVARTHVVVSTPGELDGTTLCYTVELGAHEAWEVEVDVLPSLTGEEPTPFEVASRIGAGRSKAEDSLSLWSLRVPRLRARWDTLRHAFDHSVADLAALQLRDDGGPPLLAAGMPWFMTVFGRDTIITSLQTLLLGPELAVGALDALSALQATADDASIDAEPGKIVHEVREGRAADTWFARYYGTVDATPLFLVLLHEAWRWTDDTALVRRLRGPALAALDWLDRHGDLDGDGFVEYQRRTERGLLNQSWKDSGDSQRFHDGRVATPPIAPAEVQGYVFDAKRRVAEMALEVWRDRDLASRLEREADELQARFDEAFWVPERGGFYALGLDADKRPLDARCSNMGHLLWSGIVPPERVDAVVDQLFSDTLWSGWGVRTMASDEAAFNPLSYHNGTVWPHDNSLVAWGLCRYGRWEEARRIVHALLDAAGHLEWSLPEVFAGYTRAETPFPVAYPTAARPQAWAAGTPVLLLRLLLGLEPDRPRHRLRSVVEDELPSWVGDLRLRGVPAFGTTWGVTVEGGHVRVREA